MKQKIIMFALCSLLPAAAFGKNNTPDFYRCTGRVGGEWNFGRGPNGCDASAFGEDQYVLKTYDKIIFNDAIGDRNSERSRYMDELHAVIRDAAEYYIRKRKPNVSQEEVDAWKLAMLTTANQESYWSHYRQASGLKMMRGDVGHGHGLMQVDDRYHYPAVLNGTAWNILGNITYSMDEFFTAWERAPASSCVKTPNNYEARIRSSWAAYNGGPSKICRWTNSNDTWARNDLGFVQKLRSKSWASLVQNPRKPASVNVVCLIEKKENCPPVGGPVAPVLKEGVLYKTAANKPCVFKAGTLQCLNDYRDALCLSAVSTFANEIPEIVSQEAQQSIPIRVLDRHSTCRAFDPSLFAVGKMLEANQDINLRSTPGGGLIGAMPRGEVAEILDFEIRNLATKDRYYKVNVEGVIGFVYAGSKSTYAAWATPSNLNAPLPPVVARPDEILKIVNLAGINMRSTPGGNFITNIPAGTRLATLDYTIQGKDGDVFYQVTYRGKIGFIYSGMLMPKDTTKLWTVREK